jgi:hypothetical protein
MMLYFQIREEASRCLGELGPADLTTMILKPEKCQELQGNEFKDSPILMFTAHIVRVAVDYLVDENISVVEAASAALYKILASWEGQQVIGNIFYILVGAGCKKEIIRKASHIQNLCVTSSGKIWS